MTTETTSADASKRAIARIYEEGINGNSPAVFDALVAEDYVGGSGERGPAGFAATIASLRAGVPDIHFTVEGVTGDAKAVAIRWTWKGTHTGTLRGFPASNKAVTNTGIAFYELRDGKVVRSWVQTDRLDLLQQIGVIPSSLVPSAPAPKH